VLYIINLGHCLGTTFLCTKPNQCGHVTPSILSSRFFFSLIYLLIITQLFSKSFTSAGRQLSLPNEPHLWPTSGSVSASSTTSTLHVDQPRYSLSKTSPTPGVVTFVLLVWFFSIQATQVNKGFFSVDSGVCWVCSYTEN